MPRRALLLLALAGGKEFLDWVSGCPECTEKRKIGADLVFEVQDIAKFEQAAIGRYMTSAQKKAPRAPTTRRALRR